MVRLNESSFDFAPLYFVSAGEAIIMDSINDVINAIEWRIVVVHQMS